MKWWSGLYKTDRAKEVTARVVNLPGQPELKVVGDVYEAGLGDLIYEYVSRLTVPWWKRMQYPFRRTALRSIREKLNAITVLEWTE